MEELMDELLIDIKALEKRWQLPRSWLYSQAVRVNLVRNAGGFGVNAEIEGRTRGKFRQPRRQYSRLSRYVVGQ